MSALLFKKITLLALLGLSVPAGIAGLCLVFLPDPAELARKESLYAAHLLHKADAALTRDERAHLTGQARRAQLSALAHDPHNASYWLTYAALEPSAAPIAARLDPRLGPQLKRKPQGGAE